MMKMKKLIFIALLMMSLVAFVACSSDDGLSELEDSLGNEYSEGGDLELGEEEPDLGTEEETSLLLDGSYVGKASNTEGEIEVEITVLDGKIALLHIAEQEGVEISEETIEGFNMQFATIEDARFLNFEEIPGESKNIGLVIEAINNALEEGSL